jgi:hypothetical protein
VNPRRRKAVIATAAAVAELALSWVPAGAIPAPPSALEPATGFLLTVLAVVLLLHAARHRLTLTRHYRTPKGA